MMNFLYPGAWIGAAAAAALICVPILIHLINMMRHRRIPWAAMEFLLISQKKNRTWIILKQLLLLLMRMGAIAAVVFLVPHPKLQSELGRLLGSSKTHHIILLDDSYSMSDRWAGGSAFEKAKEVIYRIAESAMAQPTPQAVTLLRFSQAVRPTGGLQPDLLKVDVDTQFLEQIKGRLGPMEPSQTAAGPLPALKAIAQLLGDEETSELVIYLISDFRAKEWSSPTDLKQQLLDLEKLGVRLSFVQCVESVHENLGIAELVPLPGIRAVGAEMFMEVAVVNHGESPVHNVPVSLEEDGSPRPAVTVRHVAPGETVRERFRVHFEKAGQHHLTARLETDAVQADNYRYVALDVPVGVPVLIIDGDPRGTEGRFLSLALESDPKARTGILPQIEQPRFLSLQPLEKFHTIYLVNIERLDASAIKALEEYVAGGGGLAMFLGPVWHTRFINEELYRNGQGLFPMPMTAPTILRVDYLERTPDIEVVDPRHPILGLLASERYKFLNAVTIEQYFAVPKEWKAPAESTVRLLARLRNGAPLVVERQFGKGRVIVFTTTCAPTWNNWAKDPSFVIAMLQMQAYLANQPVGDYSRQIGTALEVVLDPAQYESQVRVVPPAGSEGLPQLIDAVPTRDQRWLAAFADTFRQGIYQVQLTRKDNTQEERLIAYNVDPVEGNLKLESRQELTAALDPVVFEYTTADTFQYNVEEAGYNLFQVLLYALLILLVGEQMLAYSASYHPATASAPAQGGVR